MWLLRLNVVVLSAKLEVVSILLFVDVAPEELESTGKTVGVDLFQSFFSWMWLLRADFGNHVSRFHIVFQSFFSWMWLLRVFLD